MMCRLPVIAAVERPSYRMSQRAGLELSSVRNHGSQIGNELGAELSLHEDESGFSIS